MQQLSLKINSIEFLITDKKIQTCSPINNYSTILAVPKNNTYKLNRLYHYIDSSDSNESSANLCIDLDDLQFIQNILSTDSTIISRQKYIVFNESSDILYLNQGNSQMTKKVTKSDIDSKLSNAFFYTQANNIKLVNTDDQIKNYILDKLDDGIYTVFKNMSNFNNGDD